MPRLKHVLPRRQHHRASGQDVVTLDNRDFYLGPHNSKIAKAEYDRLIGEWLTNGRRLPAYLSGVADITITEVIDRYRVHAEAYYVKDGKPTCLAAIKATMKALRTSYGHVPARSFGPLSLQAMIDRFIAANMSRTYIRDHVQRIKGLFKWAVSQQLLEPSVYQALLTVSSPRKGKTAARESAPIRPVDDDVVTITIKHLPRIVADLVQVQRLTGARPGEICQLRPIDIDRSGETWVYRPASHKTQHHDVDRVIFVGPKARAILTPYLDREPEMPCFSPAESEQQRRAERHAQRKTPLQYGNRPGSSKNKNRKRPPRLKYDTEGVRRAIRRAVAKVNHDIAKQNEVRAQIGLEPLSSIKPWHPNQLRHTAATEIRKQFGLEAAGAVLGHARVDVTQVYAERNHDQARAVAAQLG